MSKPTEKEVARQILVSLYKCWENNQPYCSLYPVLKDSEFREEDFEGIVNKLENKHDLIKSTGRSGNTYNIAPAGIKYVEENALVPAKGIERHREVRERILEYLCVLFEQQGQEADENYGKILEDIEIDECEASINMTFLCDTGYIQSTSMGSFTIAEEGYAYRRGENQDDII